MAHANVEAKADVPERRTNKVTMKITPRSMAKTWRRIGPSSMKIDQYEKMPPYGKACSLVGGEASNTSRTSVMALR